MEKRRENMGFQTLEMAMLSLFYFIIIIEVNCVF